MSGISSIIERHFPYPPTGGQRELFGLFDRLIESKEPRATLLVRGYAGTGKTTAVAGIVKALGTAGYRSLLLAPTGRAAKVAAGYSGSKAFTVHKIIYEKSVDSLTGELVFRRRKNNHHRTVFIVDEASMVQEDPGSANLLRDLLDYVFEQPNNKLLLIGDDAQLPPVKKLFSGALDTANLVSNYSLNLLDVSLTEVVRQAKNSGILNYATQLRKKIGGRSGPVKIPGPDAGDILPISSMDMEEKLSDAYHRYGPENCVVICRSNRETVQFNRYIRQRILFRDEDLEAGDSVMVVKNNYFWLGPDSVTGFLANGDFAEILRIGNREEKYGLKFADLHLRLIDYPEQPPFTARAILDTLYSATPALGDKEFSGLYENIINDSGDQEKISVKNMIRQNPDFNALQIKFTYSVTCHKAQGGQWPVVFVKHGFYQAGEWDMEYLRWLYTAVSRATEKCYLVDFETNDSNA